MPTSIPMHPSHYNSYHFNDGLLFQFILHELVYSSEIILQLIGLMEGEETPETLTLLNDTLGRLVGASHESMRLLSWMPDHSPLTKLKNYCALFASQNKDSEKTAQVLHHYSDQAWLGFIQALGSLREEAKFPLQSIQRAIIPMKKLKSTVGKMLLNFGNDENVLFFIVRHQQQIDALFGKRFVRKLMLQLFPEGLESARLFMVQKYKQRGFASLIAEIEHQFTSC